MPATVAQGHRQTLLSVPKNWSQFIN